jgi:hypothetical protein
MSDGERGEDIAFEEVEVPFEESCRLNSGTRDNFTKPETLNHNDETDGELYTEGGMDEFSSLKDHFTVVTASSTVRFRSTGNTVASYRIYPDYNSQFIMESKQDAKGKHLVQIKRLTDSAFNIHILRLAYTLVAGFFSGFILVLCLKVLSIVITEFTITSGFTSKQSLDEFQAIGIFLSFPVMIYGMSAALIISFRKWLLHFIGN